MCVQEYKTSAVEYSWICNKKFKQITLSVEMHEEGDKNHSGWDKEMSASYEVRLTHVTSMDPMDYDLSHHYHQP